MAEIKFVQMSLKDAAKRYPAVKHLVCSGAIDINDENYIVRVSADGEIEIGYITDEWIIA